MTDLYDVNQRLFDERRSMIDNGATRRDDGSWVNADKCEVVGKDGLDMTAGEAALYTTVPAWHGLGTVVPGGTSSINEVLKIAHLDYQVDLVPVEYTYNGLRRVHEGQYNTVRSDTGGPLGVVGKQYTAIQNRDGFEFLEDLVNEPGGITWESAGALRGGRKTFVSMRLPGTVTIDADGINDEVIPFVALMNSFDGSSSLTAVVSPWRPVCANTERFAIRDAYTKWSVRHSESAMANLATARRMLGLTVKYFDAFKVEEEALVRTDLSMAQFEAVVNELWTPPNVEDGKRAHTIADNRKAELTALAGEARNFPGTAYGAERTLTEWLDHRGNKSDAVRATRIMEGADDDIKSAAHRQLLMLVNK